MKIFKLVTISILFTACSTSNDIPQKKYRQFDSSQTTIRFENGMINFHLVNPLKCPTRFYIITDKSQGTRSTPITIAAQRDTLFKVSVAIMPIQNLKWRQMFGDLEKEITPNKIALPFPKGKKYEVIQAYEGSYSHNNNYSRYSIDFSLKKGDTICAADNGYVVGVIKDYEKGGPDKKWLDYSNFITIYHPHSGLFTQYAHLMHNGSMVNVGDAVKTGQPIGFSGKTGWTNIEHLHFSVLVPSSSNEGLASVPIDFIEGYVGENLRRGDVVEK